MKKKQLVIFFFLAVIIILPVSNMIGLSGENEPIALVPGSSEKFAKVSPVLQNKCVDCHSPGMTRMPIYAKLPIAKQLMAKDIENGSGRLILSKQLYSGETSFTPLMLARIEGTVRNNSMPPHLYLSMHWTGRLTAEEQQDILDWIAEERAKSSLSSDATKPLKGEPIQALPLKVALDERKVALGHKLFFEKLLSGDETMNCASCHDLTKGGTDQAKVATGIRGQQGPINSPSVYNASYNLAQFWDGRAKDLQKQAAGPVANPGEMGEEWDNVVKKLSQVDEYKKSFDELYAGKGLTKATVTDAIAYFETSLVTGNSRFDQYLRGNDEILTTNEKAGYDLFKLNCASCHFGPTLGGGSYEKMGVKHNYFNLRGGELTEADNGRFNVTKDEKDRHFFKVPSLRNVELTFPYFHDGSTANLADAIKMMGKVQRNKDLTKDEITKIEDFLKSLTGDYKGKLVTKLNDKDVQ